MIQIEVQGYCSDCCDFESDVVRPQRTRTDDGKTVIQSDTIVRCKHRKRCESIARYLERKLKEESNGQL
jgi:hypothetical protein